MLIIVLAYLGGVLTILSPCVLPIIPFAFARADRPFRSNGLPMLIGMALTFAVFASLASVGGTWVVNANAWGRQIALLVLVFFALTLLVPQLAEWVSRPFVRLGSKLTSSQQKEGVGSALLLGSAMGLLWAPCAGPILGLLLTASAFLHSPFARVGLLFAYGLGAATSIGVILTAGQQLFNRLKRSLGIEEYIRRAIGVFVLAAALVIGLGFDHGILTRLSAGKSDAIEQRLISAIGPNSAQANAQAVVTGMNYPNEGALPALPLSDTWVNHAPITAATLRGKVVLIDFWTYSCINCLRTVPYVKAWDARYRKDGLVIIGVHTPEFAFERERKNVQNAIASLGIRYPVALDNDYRVWNAFHNQYWPAEYLIDSHGIIRYHAFGEGQEDETEKAIRTLLAQQGHDPGSRTANVQARGVGLSADDADDQSPETYLGSARSQHFSGLVAGAVSARSIASQLSLPLNGWGLAGAWAIGQERITLKNAPGAIAFKFHARDLHLVLGPADQAHAIHFRVWLDGKPLGDNAGMDVDAHSRGIVRAERLYQLIRQHGTIRDHIATIEFLDGGVAAYAFTFG